MVHEDEALAVEGSAINAAIKKMSEHLKTAGFDDDRRRELLRHWETRLIATHLIDKKEMSSYFRYLLRVFSTL